MALDDRYSVCTDFDKGHVAKNGGNAVVTSAICEDGSISLEEYENIKAALLADLETLHENDYCLYKDLIDSFMGQRVELDGEDEEI